MDSPNAIALPLEQSNCEEQFNALVRRQSRFVFRVAYSVTRNVQDAEDVVQETFWKLYRNGSWKAMQDEPAFLARTAWRVAVSRAPSRRTEATAKEAACPGADPEESALQTDWNARVHRLIDALPEELRVPLALSTVEELGSRAKSAGYWAFRKARCAHA